MAPTPDAPERPNSIDELTDRQKECLRLVYQRYELKEIARRLNIAPVTVEQRLKGARTKLGVSKSIQAARILAEAERGVVYDSSIYGSTEVAEPLQPTPSSSLSRLPWPVATRWRPTNDLSFMEKLTAILGLAAVFMIGTGVYFIGIRLLSDSL